jgi:DNA processing protein
MARNRIISGLSQATAVMQAAEQSGAGITARAALAQGRELYVLTHPPGDARAGGSAKLLADGAHPVMSAVDLMNRLGGISIVNPCQLDKATVMAKP